MFRHVAICICLWVICRHTVLHFTGTHFLWLCRYQRSYYTPRPSSDRISKKRQCVHRSSTNNLMHTTIGYTEVYVGVFSTIGLFAQWSRILFTTIIKCVDPLSWIKSIVWMFYFVFRTFIGNKSGGQNHFGDDPRARHAFLPTSVGNAWGAAQILTKSQTSLLLLSAILSQACTVACKWQKTAKKITRRWMLQKSSTGWRISLCPEEKDMYVVKLTAS